LRLTRSTIKKNGRRSSVYEWEGRRIRVYDDAETALRTIETFGDELMREEDKLVAVIALWLVDPRDFKRASDKAGLIAMLSWELCGIDVDGSHEDECGEKVFDWEQDIDYIKASLFNAYGMPWDDVIRAVPYRELCALVGLAPHDTPIGQALYYRTAEPPKETEHNREQVRAWKERREFWRLGGSDSASHYEAANALADDMFASLARTVKS